jgi:hypothetical protein
MRISEKMMIHLVGLTLHGCNEVNSDNHEDAFGRSREVAEVQGTYILLRTRI